MDIAAQIRDAIERNHLIPDGKDVVVGVSGGADSVALIRAISASNIPCTIAHLNHRLRGAESDADEQFVRELADELNLPVMVKSADVKGLAENTGQSLEMAARQARHEFFTSFANAVIALAHHADDQIETFFLKLARGAGPEGLCGMPFSQIVGKLRLIRPMLGIRRTEIIGWLKSNGFEWREDTSNSDPTFLRNKVRHTILPMLEKELNPNLRETVLRTMDILRIENEWMNETISDFRFPTADLSPAAQRRVLRKWLFENGAEEAGFEAVEKILSLMKTKNGTKVFELNDRQRVLIEYGIPRFEETGKQPQPEFRLIRENGSGWRKDESRIGEVPATASFDAEKVGDSPIEVRLYREGDRMEPLGMEGSRKLQDIFTDLKIPREQRSRLPVVICRGEIIWLPGYRISRYWKVPSADSKSVHIFIKSLRT